MRRFWPFVRMSILQALAYLAATVAVLIPLGVLVFLAVVAAAAIGLGAGALDNAAGIVAGVGLVLLLICGYLLGLILLMLPTI